MSDSKRLWEARDLLKQLREELRGYDNNNALRLLCYAQEKLNGVHIDFIQKIESNIIDKYEDKFEKVIFLDIDGVLNDENNTTPNYVNEQMVQRLKKIIDATGAEVILSSSWRHAFENYFSYIESEEGQQNCDISAGREKITDKYALQIFDTLNKNGIKLAG